MPKENKKNPILNPQAEGSNAASSRKGKERAIEENFASSSKTLKETICELKNQLATIPATENFATEREKIKTKITAYEIMATPAANDFLKDILAERKELLPRHSIFSFTQILTREQFYRNNIFPVEINNLIEKEVWNLS